MSTGSIDNIARKYNLFKIIDRDSTSREIALRGATIENLQIKEEIIGLLNKLGYKVDTVENVVGMLFIEEREYMHPISSIHQYEEIAGVLGDIQNE